MVTTEYIYPLLTPPNDWQWGEFQNRHDQTIRYGWNTPKNAKALVVLAEGRTECIEEYFELIRDLNAQGFACAVMDWQGHGLSYRFNNDNTRHHSKGFENDVNDFSLFLKQIDHINLPHILMAHSMGGNIGLRYLIDHDDNAFKCAFLIAPMLGLKPKRTIKLMAALLLKAASKMGHLERHALGQKRWNEIYANIAKYKVSSDPIRREKQPHLFKTRPELQCGGVTWGWLKEALKSISILRDPGHLNAVKIPVFFAMAGRDGVVDNDGTRKTASLITNGQTHIFEKAEHQIHAEKDSIRNELLHSFYGFAEKHLSSNAKDC